MAKLEKVEGIGPKYAEQLRKAGVRSAGDLLKKGAAPAGRKQIEKDSGISGKLILEWVNHVDLFRVNGVGEEYADLLEEAGVDTVVELSKRKADNLYKTMLETNAKKKLVRQMPGEKKIAAWIEHAKTLPRGITY
jgi:predicted flap endonuclease-1-like 5' DNA nuclease